MTVNLQCLQCQLQRHFWRPVVKMYLATSNNLLLVLQDAKQQQQQQKTKHFFHELAIFWSAQNWQCKDTFCFHSPSPSPVIFTNLIAVSFLLFRSSRFSFHCYTQREPTPTQKSARKWHLRPFANSSAKDYERHSLLQISFAELPNTEINLFYHYDLVPTSK